MKADHIYPFIQASQKGMQEITGISPIPREVYLKDTFDQDDHLVVLIGLIGDIEGSVMMSLKMSFVCKITSIMLGGMPVTEVDEVAISAVSELCNMILGNAASIFAQNNINVDITPPSVIKGEVFLNMMPQGKLICIPLEFAEGEYVNIDIVYK